MQMLQSIIATCIVLLATAWLARKAYQTVRGAFANGDDPSAPGCGHCPSRLAKSAQGTKTLPLVEIGRPGRRP